ncbi:MAG TPA: hypothetical protein PK156_00545, partial [Polyangium sp.]|nr:hypothetical protein [Polyangium sp.]
YEQGGIVDAINTANPLMGVVNLGFAVREADWYTVGLESVGVAVMVVAVVVGKKVMGRGSTPRRGIYEFPDQKSAGVPYVGQSGNITRRLTHHEQAGRLNPGTETSEIVNGGKLAREIAEHKRIQEITGGVPARDSPNVSNKVDPIGPRRKHLINGNEEK